MKFLLLLTLFNITAWSYDCKQHRPSLVQTCLEFQNIKNSFSELQEVLDQSLIYHCEDNKLIRLESFGSFIQDKLNNVFYSINHESILTTDKSYLKLDMNQNIFIFNPLKKRALVACYADKELRKDFVVRANALELARKNDLMNLYKSISDKRIGICELTSNKEDYIRKLKRKKIESEVSISSYETVKKTKYNLLLDNQVILALDKKHLVLEWDEYRLINNDVLQNRVVTYKKDTRKIQDSFGKEEIELSLKLKDLILKGACFEK